MRDQIALTGVYSDEKITPHKNAEVTKSECGLGMDPLQDAEDVRIVLFFLRPLRMVPAIFDIELVQVEFFRKLIEFRRSRVGNVIPAQRWCRFAHGRMLAGGTTYS